MSNHVIFILAALLCVSISAIALADTSPPAASPPTAAWTQLNGENLDIHGYRLTFEDDFKTLDIAPDGGAGKWYAPVHSSFGEAHFDPPGSASPFALIADPDNPRRNCLRIRAQQQTDGWHAGLMQTVNSRGQGFAQQYGYFELRAQLPSGKATWPAFWLLTQNGFLDKTKTRGEIDVVEFYGSDPKRLHSAVHLWPADEAKAGNLTSAWYSSNIVKLLNLAVGFHDFGVLIDPEWVTIYYDRKAVGRYPTLDEYRTPMYMLVDLAMYRKDIDEATSPSDLVVDYVKAYAK